MIQADLRTARQHPDFGMNGLILAAIVIAALAALGAIAHVLDGLFFMRRSEPALVRFISAWDIGVAFLGYLTCAAGLTRHRAFPWLYLAMALAFVTPRILLQLQEVGMELGLGRMASDADFLHDIYLLRLISVLLCVAAAYILWSPAVRITYRHRLSRDELRLIEHLQGADPRLGSDPRLVAQAEPAAPPLRSEGAAAALPPPAEIPFRRGRPGAARAEADSEPLPALPGFLQAGDGGRPRPAQPPAAQPPAAQPPAAQPAASLTPAAPVPPPAGPPADGPQPAALLAMATIAAAGRRRSGTPAAPPAAPAAAPAATGPRGSEAGAAAPGAGERGAVWASTESSGAGASAAPPVMSPAAPMAAPAPAPMPAPAPTPTPTPAPTATPAAEPAPRPAAPAPAWMQPEEDAASDDQARRQLDAAAARQRLQEELEIDRRIARLRGLASGEVSALSLGLAMDRAPAADDEAEDGEAAEGGAESALPRSTTDERLNRLRAAASVPRGRTDSVRRRQEKALSDSIPPVVHGLASGQEAGAAAVLLDGSGSSAPGAIAAGAVGANFQNRLDALLRRVDASNTWHGGEMPPDAGAPQPPEPPPADPPHGLDAMRGAVQFTADDAASAPVAAPPFTDIAAPAAVDLPLPAVPPHVASGWSEAAAAPAPDAEFAGVQPDLRETRFQPQPEPEPQALEEPVTGIPGIADAGWAVAGPDAPQVPQVEAATSVEAAADVSPAGDLAASGLPAAAESVAVEEVAAGAPDVPPPASGPEAPAAAAPVVAAGAASEEEALIVQRIDAMRILVDEGFLSPQEFERRVAALRAGG